MKARRIRMVVLQALKDYRLTVKLSFFTKKERKTFHDKNRLKRFMTTKVRG